MPIEGVSEIVRMPRLGKIRLGIIVEQPGKKPRPKATDHFVVPEEFAEILGDKPTELGIMFPTEEPAQFAQQWLRAYSKTQGLVCVGDGVTSRRKIDTATGAMASHETEEWVWKDELPCDPQECPDYLSKRCRRVMNLQVLIPDVPGLGVWQIDTSSFYSIVNINSMIGLLKAILGRCSMIPLTLALGPVEVSPPGQKKKTVYIMHIKKDIKLADLAKMAQLPPAQALIPPPEVVEGPIDLFPEEGFEEDEIPPEDRGEPIPPELWEERAEEEPPPIEPVVKPQDDPRTIAWRAIKVLLDETKPRGEVVSQYFQKHFLIAVDLSDFDPDLPLEKFTEQMLSRFHDSLLALKEGQQKEGQQKAKEK